MEMVLKAVSPGREARERLSAMLVAATVTFLVFAAIDAGFTPHATDLASRALDLSVMAL
ncbi:MAG: hypothetical protein IT486_02640 [Gammaproteobacteria bacterium]|nr:hypothetical protein [Gammaproteobacteria bacterium]